MKILKTLKSFCVLFAFASVGILAADMDAEQEWQIKSEIKQLADNYGYYRDNFMVEEYLSIWSEDAVAIDGDRMWQGHDELRTRIPDPASNRLSMHVMGTSHIEIIDESHAMGVHYATVYAGSFEGSREQSEIIEMGGIYLVAKYMDEYVLTKDGWKIAKRDIDRTFTSAN